MKKTRLINSELSALIARMGHLDEITVCDAGLPSAASIPKIDLAVSRDLPALLPVLEAILSELQIEAVIISQQCKTASPLFYQQLLDVINSQGQDISVSLVDHQQFKADTNRSQAIIRTGEHTPFANIILIAGVVF